MKKIIAMIMSVLMLATLLCGCGGGSGASEPEGAVENFIDATLDADFEAMIACLPPQISDDMIDVAEKTGEIDIDEMEEELKDEIPDDVSYEIKGKEKIEKEAIESFEKNLTQQACAIALASELDEDEIKEMDDDEAEEKMKEFEEDCKVEIEEAYYVEVEVTGDGETNTQKVPVGKIDGEWYIINMNMMNM